MWLTFFIENGDKEAPAIQKLLADRMSETEKAEASNLTNLEKRENDLEKGIGAGCEMELWKICDEDRICTDYDEYLVRHINLNWFRLHSYHKKVRKF